MPAMINEISQNWLEYVCDFRFALFFHELCCFCVLLTCGCICDFFVEWILRHS